MPEMQLPEPARAGMPAGPVMLDDAALPHEDSDYAFGCECADPALQIAQWGQDARASGAEAG